MIWCVKWGAGCAGKTASCLVTTEEFLRRFGVQSVEELPSIAPEQLEDFKEEAEREIKDRLDV